MKLAASNARSDHATNSSSSHSFFLYHGEPDTMREDQDFGRYDFVVYKDDGKRAYLGQIIRDCLRDTMADDYALLIASRLVGVQLDHDGYVDHQSVIDLPRNFSGDKSIDKEYLDDLMEWVLSSGIAVSGGSDESDNPNPHNGKKHPFTDDQADVVARKDPLGFWVLYNRKTGAKARFYMQDDTLIEHNPALRSTIPELIDLKITNKCPFGCEWCYADSTVGGDTSNNLSSIIQAISDAKVFEVAIGGGEPTLDGHFGYVLRTFRAYGVVPNFTTRNKMWLGNPEFVKMVKETCGGFAFSVNTFSEAVAVAKLAKEAEFTFDAWSKTYMTFQVPMGTVLRSEFSSILYLAAREHIPVTLLGYKSTGRGSNFNPIPYGWWIEEVIKWGKEHKWCHVNVDTALINQYAKEISELGVPKTLLYVTEGTFSCFIDGVANTIAPSSYCEPDKYIALPKYLDGDKLIECFNEIAKGELSA